MLNSIMNNDATVIGRFSTILNDSRRFNNIPPSTVQANHRIVEHNGKQFITDFKERMEQRYVQIFDTNTGRMRLFEVTDYIPTKVLRPIRGRPQYPLQKRFTPSVLPSSYPTSQVGSRLSMSKREKEKEKEKENASSLNIVQSNESLNIDHIPNGYDPYSSGTRVRYNDDNNLSTSRPAKPEPIIKNTTDQRYYASKNPQTTPSKNTSPPSEKSSPQYSSGSYRSSASSFRSLSPTASNNTTRSSAAYSKNLSYYSDSQAIDELSTSYNGDLNNNQNDSITSHGTYPDNNSPMPFDPFVKKTSARSHHYGIRPSMHNYAQPSPRNLGFSTGTMTDYAPIPVVYKQSNQHEDPYRKYTDDFTG